MGVSPITVQKVQGSPYLRKPELVEGCAKRHCRCVPSWVYILRCGDNSYYTGVSTNLEQRLDQHYHGNIGYTAKRKPIEYLWSAEFAHLDDAYAFEKRVKGWSRAKKEALMRGDWPEIQRLARIKRKA